MHGISNERALSHWQALNRLPATAANYLQTRFLREQPVLAGVFLPPPDDSATAPDQIPDFDDPVMADFRRWLNTGAILNETFQREAGRPLRPVAAEELDVISEEIAALVRGPEATATGSERERTELLLDSSQRALLMGAANAHLEDVRDRPGGLIREILMLRIVIEGLHRACGDEPATAPGGWDKERIQFALSTQGDPMRHEALAACDVFRAELVPDLLAELAGWAEEPQEALAGEGALGMHALFLLGKWREEAAWPVFRKIFSQTDSLSDDLMGDLITEDGSVLLAMVGGGRREELLTMVRDELLDPYCRNACIDALTSLVAWGDTSREQHVDCLRELLTTGLRTVPENEHVYGGVVSAVCDLEAWELSPEVEAAFARGAVDEGFVDLKYFKKALAQERGGAWDYFCNGHRKVEDVASLTEWLDESPLADDDAELFPEDDDRVNGRPGQPYIAPPKIGRNAPCPCGSGKKYKKCCLR